MGRPGEQGEARLQHWAGRAFTVPSVQASTASDLPPIRLDVRRKAERLGRDDTPLPRTWLRRW